MDAPPRYQPPHRYRPPAAMPGHDPARLRQVNADAAAYYQSLLDGHQPAWDYLRQRGIADAADPWQLGYAPAGRRTLVDHLRGLGYGDRDIHVAGLARHNRRGQLVDRFRDRLVFPVHDHHAAVVGFTARDLSGRPRAAKYLNTPTTPLYRKSRLLYGLGVQLRQPPPGQQPPLVIIAEGAADAVAIWHMARATAALPDTIPIYAVAPCGTSLTRDQLALLAETLPTARIAACFDGDQPGRRAFLRTYPLLRDWHGQRLAVALPEGLDPADLLASHGPAEALTRLATAMQPAARAALTATLDQLTTAGHLTRPAEWAADRLLAYQAIADYFTDDPTDLPALATAAADRLGITDTDVVRGVLARTFHLNELDHLSEAEPPTAPAPGRAVLAASAAPVVHSATGHKPPPGEQQPTVTSTPSTVAAAAPANTGHYPGPVTGTYATQQGVQRHHGDATATAPGPNSRQAWVLADGIGDRPETADAAVTACRIAIDVAARTTSAAGVTAAGAALNASDSDADVAMVVATTEPIATGTRGTIAWAGNARAYTLHHGQLRQLTTDHTVAQQHHDNGQPVASDSILHHLLTASARSGPVGRTTVDLPPGASLLLCTAGLHRHLDPTHARQALGPVRDPATTLRRLLTSTGPAGGNATALLLHTPHGPASAPTPAALAYAAYSAPFTNSATADAAGPLTKPRRTAAPARRR